MTLIESFRFTVGSGKSLNGPRRMNWGLICGSASSALWDWPEHSFGGRGVLEILTPDEYDEASDILVTCRGYRDNTVNGQRRVLMRAGEHLGNMFSNALFRHVTSEENQTYVPVVLRAWLNK